MKKWVGIFIVGIGLTVFGCKDKRTAEQVLSVDTTGVRYDVEKTVRNKTTDIDTNTKHQTIEENLPNRNKNNNNSNNNSTRNNKE